MAVKVKRNKSGRFVKGGGKKARTKSPAKRKRSPSGTGGRKARTSRRRKSAGKSGGGMKLSIGGLLGMAKENFQPALLAIGAVALAYAVTPKTQKFNFLAVGGSALIPIVASRVLKKFVSPQDTRRAVAFALFLSLFWEGARASIIAIPGLKWIVEGAEKLGSKVPFGKNAGVAAFVNEVPRAMPTRANQAATRTEAPSEGVGDVSIGYRGSEFASNGSVVNFQRG